MNPQEKFYRLALNMLEDKADVTLSWDCENEKYTIVILKEKRLGFELELQIDDNMQLTRVFLRDTITDERWHSLFPEELDNILEIIRDYTKMDFLLEGIDE